MAQDETNIADMHFVLFFSPRCQLRPCGTTPLVALGGWSPQHICRPPVVLSLPPAKTGIRPPPLERLRAAREEGRFNLATSLGERRADLDSIHGSFGQPRAQLRRTPSNSIEVTMSLMIDYGNLRPRRAA